MRRLAFTLVSLGLVAASAAPALASSPPRSVRLVSGGAGSQIAAPGGMAAKGTRTVFSTDEKLLPADTNATPDLYARDADGTLQLVSSGAGTDTPVFRGISPDGERTWYTTTHADLPASDSDSSVDVYERRRNGQLRQISVGNGAFDATFLGGSADGDHVLWSTAETITAAGDADVTPLNDLFDRRGDGTFRLVTPNTAVAVTADPTRHALSDDGVLASFSTTEDLDNAKDGDLTLDTYSVPTLGGSYTLLTPGTTTPTSAFVNSSGTLAWFVTADPVDPDLDTDTVDDVYERDSDGVTHLLSGGASSDPATLVGAMDDTSSTVFSTAEALLPTDTDGAGVDLYERRDDDTLHLISGGTTGAAASFIGENADGSIIFQTSDDLLPADTDGGTSDVYLRKHDGVLVLLTPDTPGALGVVHPGAAIPGTLPRTVFTTTVDLPGTGDTNGMSDVYEALPDGAHLLAPGAASGTNFTVNQAADGSRISFLTESPLAGTGDADDAQDVYEADFAIPTFSGMVTVAGTGKVGSTHKCTAPTVIGEAATASFSWLRDATAIKAAVTASYRPVAADAGHQLRCRVTATNPIGSGAINSAPRGIAPVAAANRLAGFPIVGLKLTCTTFAGAASTRYAWKRGTRSVKGRTARTYKIGRSDLGKRLTCTAVGRTGVLSSTATLRLTVPSRCVVPAVRGLTPLAAKTRLGNAGCRSTTTKVSGSGVARGLALSTSPGKGAKRANGARITIRVRR